MLNWLTFVAGFDDVAVMRQLIEQGGGQPDSHRRFYLQTWRGRLQTSTLRRRINQRDWSQIADELHRCFCGGGKPLPSLVLRRREESKLLLAS